MKTANRARQNTGKIPATVQSETPAKTRPQNPAESSVKPEPGETMIHSALDELEHAIRRAHAFFILVEHQVCFPPEEEWNELIKCGIAELGHEVFANLYLANAKVRYAKGGSQ
jgi:hypothetical protein